MAAHMRAQGEDVNLPEVRKFNPPNRLLCGPGPGNAHPRVLSKMSLPQVGHLDPYFIELMEDIKALLRYTFQTTNEFTIPVSGTGSAAMEACVCNMLEPGDTILIGVNGYFGNRLCDMVNMNLFYKVLMLMYITENEECDDVELGVTLRRKGSNYETAMGTCVFFRGDQGSC